MRFLLLSFVYLMAAERGTLKNHQQNTRNQRCVGAAAFSERSKRKRVAVHRNDFRFRLNIQIVRSCNNKTALNIHDINHLKLK